MSSLVHPIILCGGSGTRLWPLSRKSYAKQFVDLVGDKSLFQASVKRVTGSDFADPLVVTAANYRFIVRDQLDRINSKPAEVLIEPSAKNTAAAICAAAVALDTRSPGALMLVAPSDHVIPDSEAFQEMVQAAVPVAQSGQLVTFGILPSRAETGYGWIEVEETVSRNSDLKPLEVKSFVEKPDETKAHSLLKGGKHLWNAGIFLFSTAKILEAFKRFEPAIFEAVTQAYSDSKQDLAFTRLNAEAWDKLASISIDYAVMERADNISVVPFVGSWSDLGDWQAVLREAEPDENGLVTSGKALGIECSNSLLQATNESQQLVGIGLEDIVAVAMPDAVLVAHKDRAQDVIKAVDVLKEQGASQAETHPRDNRPWGWFESLALGPRFQVKRIVVTPGSSLSLQSHHHRAEHWIVVQGTAKVTVDDSVTLVSENQSVYIPLGAVHRLENPGKVELTLIEVQTGSYLGEDDIIRYSDQYARE